VTSTPSTPSTLPPRPVLLPGARLGRYRLDGVVGQGAFSTVWSAHDTALDLPVVIKVLSDDASPSAIERFRREILFSRRLEHPGFNRIFELHEDVTVDGVLRWLTMSPVQGRTLGDVMNEGLMSPRRALALARSLGDVMATAHAQGIVHGDLKPSNVMVRPRSASSPPRRVDNDDDEAANGDFDDEVVVLDFGAATAADIEDPSVRVGSLRYMAPELFTERRPSPQTDVWAIGVILYGALTGALPYDGNDERAIAEAARAGAARPPSSLRKGLPAVVDAVVSRALSPSRRDRWADGRALADALDLTLAEMVPPPSPWRRLRALFSRRAPRFPR
jgi:serine/threonine-protein kinase